LSYFLPTISPWWHLLGGSCFLLREGWFVHHLRDNLAAAVLGDIHPSGFLRLDLLFNPEISLFEALAEVLRRSPSKLFLEEEEEGGREG